MFWEGNVRHIFLNLSFYPNVRGQGTRHLVEGTLDPLVGEISFLLRILLVVIKSHSYFSDHISRQDVE